MRARHLLAMVVAGLVLVLPAAASAALPFVAIDPGHGGGDGGAVGRLVAGTDTGMTPRTDAQGRTVILEKDVNLDVGLRLDAYLKARGGQTMLTRTTDAAGGDLPFTTTSNDLKARTDAANAAGAALFVSIHNNSHATTSSGIETFHFYYATAAARTLASDIQSSLVSTLQLPDRGVKSAGFYVLRHSRMPAVLAEGAFLSNPAEAQRLADPAFRQAMAEAIGRGVETYSNRAVTAPPRLGPTLGPWAGKPRSAPPGYRLVKTGKRNPVGRGGWLAVIEGFVAAPVSLPATIGPWKVRPKVVPPGYRLVKTGRRNPVGRGGWLAIQRLDP